MIMEKISSYIWNVNKVIHNRASVSGFGSLWLGGFAAVELYAGLYSGIFDAGAAIGLGHVTYNSIKNGKFGGNGHLAAFIGVGISSGMNIVGSSGMDLAVLSEIEFTDDNIGLVFGGMKLAALWSYLQINYSGVKTKAFSSWDHFKYHALGQKGLEEDIFIKDSEKALKRVRENGFSSSVYEALLYADDESIKVEVVTYLKKLVDEHRESFQSPIAIENMYQHLLDFYRLNGKVQPKILMEMLAQPLRKKRDNIISHIQNGVFLTETLENEGLEGYVRELSGLYPDSNSYSPSEFSSSSTNS